MTQNDIESRWAALAFDPLRAVFTLYDPTHPLDFYIGRDSNSQRLFLLVTPETPPPMRDMRAIRIRTYRREDGKWSVLLTLDIDSLGPMFALLCKDLIESSRAAGLAADKSLGFVLRRLSNWRKLFERAPPDLLSESQVRGLCGELVFLKKLLNFHGRSPAVRAWVGPQGAPQDFQSPDSAWEVKSVRPGAMHVTISSEEQLQTHTCPVFLVVIELADASSAEKHAFTLNSLVDSIRDKLADDFETSEILNEKLITAGYFHRPEYDAAIFLVSSIVGFEVGRDFPCITSKMFLPGIKHVSYDLMLEACKGFTISLAKFTDQRDQ